MSNATSILVVGDEPSMLGYMRTLLELDSHRVETASRGEDALQRVRRDPQPSVVLLDLMPGWDGLDPLCYTRVAKRELRDDDRTGTTDRRT